MADELVARLDPSQTGLTIVARLRTPSGAQQGVDISCPENVTVPGHYSGDMPAAPANVYLVDFVDTVSGRPKAIGEMHWSGTEELTVEDTVDDIATLSAGLQAQVIAALNTQGYSAARAVLLDNLSTILTSVEKNRKVLSNKVVVSLDELTVTVYEDNGTTVAFQFAISADKLTRTPI